MCLLWLRSKMRSRGCGSQHGCPQGANLETLSEHPTVKVHSPKYPDLTASAETFQYGESRARPSIHEEGESTSNDRGANTIMSPILVQQLQADLAGERNRISQLEQELATSKVREADVRKVWRRAANELDRIRVQKQSFPVITDDYLIEKETTPGSDCYKWLLRRQDSCSKVAQAVIWRVLVGEIFNQFQWAGNAAEQMRDMCKVLKPKPSMSDIDATSHYEQHRKFQMWSANTAGLLFETLDLEKDAGAQSQIDNHNDMLAEELLETIGLLMKGEREQFKLSLFEILDIAISLDKELSRQSAQVVWTFKEVPLDPSLMDLDERKISSENLDLELIVQPGLKKREIWHQCILAA
ncbi:uncharacterized protein LY89DRAFT_724623 [Mollisia scopiformis]|uniref:Uncharacterized protein n=1 Tax=Mollisia scopiformis TaxID=149040 RepID=A0A132B9L7_MOLSC|nr:uncharacterized protein LY89DRAFT_724623 [Mollisia scopiformis]KUJ09098.1 hypothetical protein LY89DRAFT_724623 [Mollisia scopiformis]